MMDFAKVGYDGAKKLFVEFVASKIDYFATFIANDDQSMLAMEDRQEVGTRLQGKSNSNTGTTEKIEGIVDGRQTNLRARI